MKLYDHEVTIGILTEIKQSTTGLNNRNNNLSISDFYNTIVDNNYRQKEEGELEEWR